MKILILGAGMYVTGRSGSGVGTILSSLAQTSRELTIEDVTVIARDPDNKRIVTTAINAINKKIHSSLQVCYENIDVTGNKFLALLKKVKYDCAIIALPDHLHFKATKILLENRIHCLVVKPLTPTLLEAKILLRIQRENGLYAAVEFHKRFDETNLYVKRILDENVLGQVLYFVVEYSQRISIPIKLFRKWAEKTNIFQYLGVHYADLIFFLTGYVPIRVMSVGTRKLLKSKGINTYDSIHVMLEWQNQSKSGDMFISQIVTNWIDPENSSALSDQKFKVIGTKGRIECDQKNRGLELVHQELGIKHVNPYFSEYLYGHDGKLQFTGYAHKSIGLFINDIYDIKQKNKNFMELEKVRPTFKQALVSTAIVDAVNKSLENNSTWVKINDIFGY